MVVKYEYNKIYNGINLMDINEFNRKNNCKKV